MCSSKFVMINDLIEDEDYRFVFDKGGSDLNIRLEYGDPVKWEWVEKNNITVPIHNSKIAHNEGYIDINNKSIALGYLVRNGLAWTVEGQTVEFGDKICQLYEFSDLFLNKICGDARYVNYYYIPDFDLKTFFKSLYFLKLEIR